MAIHSRLAWLLLTRDCSVIRSDHTCTRAEVEQSPSTDHRFEAGAKATDSHGLSGGRR
jgi:hypothetical protein